MKSLYTLCLLLFSLSLLAQNPSENVTFLGTWDNDTLATHNFGTFNDVWGYAADGREYAIMGSAAHVHILDITDPANIVEVQRITPGGQNTWRDFKVFQDHMYAVSDNAGEGMLVIDMSTLPDSASVVKTMTGEFIDSHNIYLEEKEGRLYTAGADGFGTHVYDVCTDPANPIYLGNAPLDGATLHDLYVRDNIAYCSAGNPGFEIWDLTDPTDGVLIASAETNGYNHSAWVTEDGQYAIFAEEVPQGLPMGVMELENMMAGDIQVNNYFRFPLLAPSDLEATPHNPYVKGNYVFTSYYEDGLIIFDITDPTNPTRAGYFDTWPGNTEYNWFVGAWGCYPYSPTGKILVSDMDFGLFVLDFDLDTNQFDGSGVCGVSSSNEPEADRSVKLFPNPTGDILTVQTSLSQTGEIKVFDTRGALLYSYKASDLSSNFEIDVQAWAAGVYYLTVSDETGITTKKFSVY